MQICGCTTGYTCQYHKQFLPMMGRSLQAVMAGEKEMLAKTRAMEGLGHIPQPAARKGE
jgi:hypothetical protein